MGDYDKLIRHNASCYGLGVYYQKRARPFRVQFSRKRKTIHVGVFKDLKSARSAAQDFIRKNPT